MSGARRERRERLLVQGALGEPAGYPLMCRRRQKELGWSAVRVHVERACRLEVALWDGHAFAVQVDLRRDQDGPGELAFGVPGPLAGNEQAQRGAAQAAVQIEPVRRSERPQPSREVGDPLVWLELDDSGEMGILDDQRRHRAFGDEIE